MAVQMPRLQRVLEDLLESTISALLIGEIDESRGKNESKGGLGMLVNISA